MHASESDELTYANKWQNDELLCPLTAGRAVVTDDWQQVIAGGQGGAVFGQERLQIQAFEWKWDMGAYLGGVHQLVSEALQVNAQDLEGREFGFLHLRKTFCG